MAGVRQQRIRAGTPYGRIWLLERSGKNYIGRCYCGNWLLIPVAMLKDREHYYICPKCWEPPLTEEFCKFVVRNLANHFGIFPPKIHWEPERYDADTHAWQAKDGIHIGRIRLGLSAILHEFAHWKNRVENYREHREDPHGDGFRLRLWQVTAAWFGVERMHYYYWQQEGLFPPSFE